MEFHEDIIENAGKTLDLKCPAEGYPSPKITWFKDEKPLLDRPIGTVSTLMSDLSSCCRLNVFDFCNMSFFTHFLHLSEIGVAMAIWLICIGFSLH